MRFPERIEGCLSTNSQPSNPDWKAGKPSHNEMWATSIPHFVYYDPRADHTTENQEYTSRAGSMNLLSPIANPDPSESPNAGTTHSAHSSPLTSISADSDVETTLDRKMINSFPRCHDVASATKSVNRQLIRQSEPCTAIDKSMRGGSIPTCTACAQKERISDVCRFRGTYLRRLFAFGIYLEFR